MSVRSFAREVSPALPAGRFETAGSANQYRSRVNWREVGRVSPAPSSTEQVVGLHPAAFLWDCRAGDVLALLFSCNCFQPLIESLVRLAD